MAKDTTKSQAGSSKSAPKGRKLKKTQTVRERAEKSGSDNKKPRRIKQAGSTAVRPLKAIARTGRKEFYLPLPDNKAGKFLNKRRHVIPRYFKGAWEELRQVEWPKRRETIRLTIAVFIFATFFMLLISLTDYGLDKVFKKLILK